MKKKYTLEYSISFADPHFTNHRFWSSVLQCKTDVFAIAIDDVKKIISNHFKKQDFPDHIKLGSWRMQCNLGPHGEHHENFSASHLGVWKEGDKLE